jgi:pimeloyl-ACP methyl ester carboxylesterase
MVLLAGGAPAAAQDATPPAAAQDAAPQVVGDEPCGEDMAEGFRCVTLRMPLDHWQDTGRTIDVTYAIRRHSGTGAARGTFVTLTGGPGTSGIASAASYTDSFDEAVQRDYDIVFLDQRGAYLSGNVTCPNAALDWYMTGSDPGTSTATTGLGADAQAFVDACLAESRVDPAILPFLGTRQAVGDLEAIREHLGAERLMLYGESYGTQYAQAYASAHPGRIAGLIVDGPVDLTRSLFDYYDEQSEAFDEALEGTLYDCTSGRPCTTDVLAPNPLVVWDDLAADLAKAPRPFEYHATDGTTETRELTAAGLLNAGSAFLYSEYDRMLLQRAVAAASQGDLWYLSRLLYAGLVMDPDTQEAVPDPSYSDGLYYAVECLDYAVPGDTPEERAEAYLDAGRELGMADRRMGDIFYGDLPCAWWPAQPESSERPHALTDVPYPMLILGATLDPATPWVNGERIAAAAGANARTIVKPGGPHVIFGRGERCPDDLVTELLVSGTLPRAARTVCAGDVADDYARLAPMDASTSSGTLAALRAVDREVVTSVDYWYWDAEKPLATGCRFGGSIRYLPTDSGSRVRLDGCSWSRGLALTGTGRIDDDEGTFSLRVRQDGTDGPEVRYLREADGDVSVDGELPLYVAGGS